MDSRTMGRDRRHCRIHSLLLLVCGVGSPEHALEEAQAVADEADRAWGAHLP